MSLSLDVEYGVLAKQNLGNGYVNAIKLSSNLEKIVSAINDISSAVKTNIVVRSVNSQLPQNETNDINLNILRPDKNETDVYKEILSSEYQFMQESTEVSFQATEIGKKEFSAGGYKIQSILVDDNKILAGSNGNGIFYSEDNGETFEQATFEQAAGLELNQSINVIKKFFGKYFAGTGNSVYQSTDGKNWTIFTNKVGKNAYQISEKVNDLLQVKYGNRKILIAATDNGVVAVTNSYAKKTLIGGTAYALTKDDKNNVYFSANGNIYVISIEEINNYLIINYLTAADVKKSTEENSEIQESDLHEFKFGSNVYDMLIKDETLFAAVSYTVEDNSRIRSITTKYGIKKAPISDLSQQSFTNIFGISQQISYLKTNGYGIYTQIKNGSYPTFWFTANGQDFTSYQTKLNDDISEFDFIDNFTMVAGANGGIIKFKQTADYIRDKLITEIDLLANNEQLCTYINEQDYNTCSSANKYTDDEISALDKDISSRIQSEIDYIKNNTLSSYEKISTFNQDYISLGKNTYNNNANKQNNNVAIGKDVVVTEKDSIGLGQNISASGSNNIAIGNNLSTSNTNAIAIGYNLTSDPNAGEHSIAVGYDAVALCADSIAIGRMISTETASTTKIGAAFRNYKTADNAETIALELCANIETDGKSASKAYITTNRFTKNNGTNTGEWSEISKKEISLEGHKHLLADITDSGEKFRQYDVQINDISTYVSAIPDNVEKISVDLYSLSSETSTISTQLCNEIIALNANINNQKVTAVTALNAYTKDGASSSDTVKFPTAAAITQWVDGRYATLTAINTLSTQLGLVQNDLQKTQGLVYEVYISPNNEGDFINGDEYFNNYLTDNGNISAGNDDNYEKQLNIALSSIDAKTVYDYYNNKDDGEQHREELTSIPFLSTLNEHLSSSSITNLTAISTIDIETFRTHRQRQFPLFTLTKACQFLANFRAKGNTSYFINCVPGIYYYSDNQSIINPDCNNTSKNLLTICRIDAKRREAAGKKQSIPYLDFEFNKCIEFNFSNLLYNKLKNHKNFYDTFINVYCYTKFEHIRVSSGLNSTRIMNAFTNGISKDNIIVGTLQLDSPLSSYTFNDITGNIPIGNTLSCRRDNNNNIIDIIYTQGNDFDGTIKYKYIDKLNKDEQGNNKEYTRYFKTYGIVPVQANVIFEFVELDRISHGFNSSAADITIYSIKFTGCAMGFHAQNSSNIIFNFSTGYKYDTNTSSYNTAYKACIIDIGNIGILGQASDRSVISVNYKPEILDYKNDTDLSSLVGNELWCTPKYIFKGSFTPKKFCQLDYFSFGLFNLAYEGTNNVSYGAGLNGNKHIDVVSAATDVSQLSVRTPAFINKDASETEKNMSSNTGYKVYYFYNPIDTNDKADSTFIKTTSDIPTDRFLTFFFEGTENGKRLPIFKGENIKDQVYKNIMRGLEPKDISAKYYEFTYNRFYTMMSAIGAIPNTNILVNI